MFSAFLPKIKDFFKSHTAVGIAIIAAVVIVIVLIVVFAAVKAVKNGKKAEQTAPDNIEKIIDDQANSKKATGADYKANSAFSTSQSGKPQQSSVDNTQKNQTSPPKPASDNPVDKNKTVQSDHNEAKPLNNNNKEEKAMPNTVKDNKQSAAKDAKPASNNNIKDNKPANNNNINKDNKPVSNNNNNNKDSKPANNNQSVQKQPAAKPAASVATKAPDNGAGKDAATGKEDETLERETPAGYRLIYDKENHNWMIKKDGAKRIIRRVKTKEEALKIAKELSKNQDTFLVVHKKDGKFQKK